MTDLNNTPCIVVNQLGLRESVISKIKLGAAMTTHHFSWRSRPATCIYFPNPKNAWRNKIASFVTGLNITGNAVLFGQALTIDSLSQPVTKSWASIASELPKLVPLDDMARARLEMEAATRSSAWQEYFHRKSLRRQVAIEDNEEMEDLMNLVNSADSDMIAWQNEEDFSDLM